QYLHCSNQCKDIFLAKARDYGTSWRVYRTISIVDQIFIKAWRIRQIQEGVLQKIDDSVESEWKAIVNYGIIGTILLKKEVSINDEIPVSTVQEWYEEVANDIKELM